MTEGSAVPGVNWKIRKRFWSGWQVLRFTLAKERPIKIPRKNGRTIGLVPFKTVHPAIPLDNVLTFDKLPRSESDAGLRVMTALSLGLTRAVDPMEPDLSEISPNADQALNDGYSSIYRRKFRPPYRPDTFGGDSVELGELAVKSPYAIFLERSATGELQWDFGSLGHFEHHSGLRNLGLRVVFTELESGGLQAVEIDGCEYGRVRRGKPNWEPAVRLAVCAATTHMSLTRHFNYVHLICANHWDAATRNCLPVDHPLYRLVWPHLANGLYTNFGITRGQLLPDGDFVNIFSFTHAGLVAYFDAMYSRYNVSVTDPEADWQRRGLAGVAFDHPSHDNLVEVFGLMHDHATRYVNAYYGSDEELRRDAAVSMWLEHLNRYIPNGLEELVGSETTREGLARLIGGFIYEGNTIHDLAGTTLWDYQLWADHNPVRVYRNGRRVPVDVFQRMINNNFGLQLKRAPLLANYGYLALADGKGPALFSQFFQECEALQHRYDETHGDTWRMEPKNLEMSMNG